MRNTLFFDGSTINFGGTVNVIMLVINYVALMMFKFVYLVPLAMVELLHFFLKVEFVYFTYVYLQLLLIELADLTLFTFVIGK